MRQWETYRGKLRRRPVRHQHATTTSSKNPPPTTGAPLTVAIAIGTAETETGTDYGTLRKAELQALAEENGLDMSGTRSDLIARLEEDA